MKPNALPPPVQAFARAVGWGGFAGAAPFLMISIPLGIGTLFSGDPGNAWWTGFFVIGLPLLVSLPIVLAASLLLGLPLTAFLSSMGKETGQTYVVGGFLFGAAPFITLVLWLGEFGASFWALPGSFGGAVTGWVWGRYRDELLAEQSSD